MNSAPAKTSTTHTISTIPTRTGVGVKPEHFETILETQPDIGWFEMHPENYMSDGGPMHHYLGKIRENYPLSIHAVGLSLGSADGLCPQQLKAMKALIDRYQPGLVSEHLSWSRWHNIALNDLLPVPYTHEAMSVFKRNIDTAQTTLQRQILIENPSSYFSLKEADYSEQEFLVSLAQQAGCKILLDVNNVYVSACNHQFDAKEYIQSIPPELVGEIHLAGHAIEKVNGGEIRIDDHGSKTCDDVWDLYQFTLNHTGVQPTLIEWDSNIPEWQTLYEEAQTADRYLNKLSKAVA